MLRRTQPSMARYQPWALAMQMRFKWRHRMDENWRRLMDASCFIVDWQSRPKYNAISQFGGNWSHVVVCAHCVAPWDYPNFYPPTGPTRFVSKITAADTEVQIRQPSLQGEIVHRTFASKFTTYIHRNPRLDLAVIHVEQAMRRAQETKMLWMQNEGFHLRPRFELLEELQEGDTVWIYGCTARGEVFDEESRVDPLMVPTGVRGVVRLVTEEHFFVDTSGDELHGNVEMGMCGSAVMRNGKLVGMLTATVAATNEDQRVAKCSMCTHARDIRAFLLEVERQMKDTPPPFQEKKTVFQERREEDGTAPPPHKNWDVDEMRLARHVKVPITLWKMEEDWTCDEDRVNQQLWGSKNGLFSKEAQEETFGMHYQDTRDDGKAPEGMELHTPDGGRPHHTSNRPDPNPTNVYIKDGFASYSGSNDESATTAHVKDFYRGVMGAEETEQMDKFKRSVEAVHYSREREDLHRSTLDLEHRRRRAEEESWRSSTGSSLFGQSPLKPGQSAMPASRVNAKNAAAPGRAASYSSAGPFASAAAPEGASSAAGAAEPKSDFMDEKMGSPEAAAARDFLRRKREEDGDLEGLWGKH